MWEMLFKNDETLDDSLNILFIVLLWNNKMLQIAVKIVTIFW